MARTLDPLHGRRARPFPVLMAAAQPESPAPLTLAEAVDTASKNYPSIRVSQEQMNAAAAGIRLARTAYLPRLDALAQVNRATRNNVFGLLLPQNVNSLHVRTGHRDQQYRHCVGQRPWGTGYLGALRFRPAASQRRDRRMRPRTQAEASVKRTQFEIAAATIDAYLTLAAAQQMVRTAQAGVDRARDCRAH